MDNRDAPATKGDLENFKTLLEEMQGHILTSIYRLAESNQLRLTQAEANQSALMVRLGALEERITELEKRFGVPLRQMQ